MWGQYVLKKESMLVCLSVDVCLKRGDSLSLLCVECLARAPHSPACCSCYGHQHSTREMLTKAKLKSKEVQVGFYSSRGRNKVLEVGGGQP